jgi:hypothetical protein
VDSVVVVVVVAALPLDLDLLGYILGVRVHFIPSLESRMLPKIGILRVESLLSRIGTRLLENRPSLIQIV